MPFAFMAQENCPRARQICCERVSRNDAMIHKRILQSPGSQPDPKTPRGAEATHGSRSLSFFTKLFNSKHLAKIVVLNLPGSGSPQTLP